MNRNEKLINYILPDGTTAQLTRADYIEHRRKERLERLRLETEEYEKECEVDGQKRKDIALKGEIEPSRDEIKEYLLRYQSIVTGPPTEDTIKELFRRRKIINTQIYEGLKEYLDREPTNLELGKSSRAGISYRINTPSTYEEANYWKEAIRRIRKYGIDKFENSVNKFIAFKDDLSEKRATKTQGFSLEEKYLKHDYLKAPSFPLQPIRYSTECLKDLLSWIPRQDKIFGCQYYLTSEAICQALSKVPTELVLHQHHWMSIPRSEWNEKDTKIRNNILNKMNALLHNIRDDKGDCGVWFLPCTKSSEGRELLMHQKWLIGCRDLYHYFKDDPNWEHNLVCGSFNLTELAPNHIESLFFVDNLDKLTNKQDEKLGSIYDFIDNLDADFLFLKQQSISWEALREQI